MHKTHNYEAIRPASSNFRDMPIDEAFTWEEGLADTGELGLYVVAFHSIRNQLVEARKVDQLLALDAAAFRDAKQADGFGTYWHDDELSPDGVALSFCAWESEQAAKSAAGRPLHRKAVDFIMSEGRDVYLDYTIQTQYIHATDSGILLRAA